MSRLIRLVYTSNATFSAYDGVSGMTPEVEEILLQARANNKRAHIGGVLYFADGYFFQCLEGEEAGVLNLVERLEQDGRHSNLKISYCKHVKRRHFKDWTMKYIPVSTEVLDFVHARGYSVFTPGEFDEHDINALVDLFTRLEDSSLKSAHLRVAHRLTEPWWKRLLRSPSQIRIV